MLEYLLEVADSSILTAHRYFTTLQPVAVLDVLMTDGTNPRSLYFQISHLVDLYRRLPRHVPADLSAMQHAMEMLENLDIQALDFPLPGSDLVPQKCDGPSRLDRSLDFLQLLLPSWADNLSRTYFDHAHTFPISIGG